MNIVVIGDYSSTNLGDPILTESTLHIVNQIKFECDFIETVKIFDIAGRQSKKISLTDKLKEVSVSPDFDENREKNIKKNYKNANIRAFIKWCLKDKKNFKARLYSFLTNNDTNVFIIAGGALLSRSLFYALRLNHIVKTAEKRNGKVIFNAVGIEKCPSTSASRIYARNFLSSKSIVAFSTRDQVNEITSLVNKEDFLVRIPDPGIFASETYNVKKQDSDIVGIGAISLEAYKSVALEDMRAEKITAADLFDFWYGITSRLDEAGQSWKMFTNGGAKDCNMAYTFLKMYNYSVDDHLVPPAETPEELVEQISQFKVVAAHRLHALIIANSLCIPFISFVWSDKVVKFSESVNNKNYFWPDASHCEQISKILCDDSYHSDASAIMVSKKQAKDFLKNSLSYIS